MNMKKTIILFAFLLPLNLLAQNNKYESFIWKSEIPKDCPFGQSETYKGIRFAGKHAEYTNADTYYPTWAANDTLYSPWTDGRIGEVSINSSKGPKAMTGAVSIVGDNPEKLKIEVVSTHNSPANPYTGRYPCGSLVYKGVWYFGTYTTDTEDCEDYPYKAINKAGLSTQMLKGPNVKKDSTTVGWAQPYLGPFVGFRTSEDYGKTWTETPHNPYHPLFKEELLYKRYSPTKIGAPHFVDFGQELEHSPDGKAYLVAHGAIDNDSAPRCGNTSWISGDAIYLVRVKPSKENMNDESKYEYFAGYEDTKSYKPIWSDDLSELEPLVEWNNMCGCVNMTYLPDDKKYIMTITNAPGTSTQRFNTYMLESDNVTGPWKIISYMKDFGEQAYFVNIPSKFVNDKTMWLCYSANYSNIVWAQKFKSNPPGSKYAMCLQEIELVK